MLVVGDNENHLPDAKWVGYAYLLDAITSSIPLREPGYPSLSSWFETIELRSGVSKTLGVMNCARSIEGVD